MTLCTVILEYCGGTYISQVRADSPAKGLWQWLGALTDEDLQSWLLKKNVLGSALRGREPVGIGGVSNVWCCSASIDDHFVLINIIATAESIAGAGV
jgi:hypothetical protein